MVPSVFPYPRGHQARPAKSGELLTGSLTSRQKDSGRHVQEMGRSRSKLMSIKPWWALATTGQFEETRWGPMRVKTIVMGGEAEYYTPVCMVSPRLQAVGRSEEDEGYTN